MSSRTINALTAVAVVLVFWGILHIAFQFAGAIQRRVPCDMAEFHPDITPKERQACRQLRTHKL